MHNFSSYQEKWREGKKSGNGKRERKEKEGPTLKNNTAVICRESEKESNSK